jgi:hypothetical protein
LNLEQQPAPFVADQAKRVLSLPFVIRLASSEQDLLDLVGLRARTYIRHNAPAAKLVGTPEEQDRRGDALLLIARSKLDGTPVGSVRVQTRVSRPLLVESAMRLPEDVARSSPIELMRGSITNGTAGRMVSAAFGKATFLLCREMGFSHVIVTCREPVNLMYRAYQFDELLSGELIHLPYSPGARHKVLCLPMVGATERWRSDNKPLFDFMMNVDHPDIQVDFTSARSQLGSAGSVTIHAAATPA